MNLLEFADQLKDFDRMVLEDDVLKAVSREDKTPLVTPWSMSLEDIKAVDKRLPLAIDAQIAHDQSNKDYSNKVSAARLRETAIYWTGTKLIPTDWGVIPYHRLCYFTEVNLEAEKPRVVIVVQRCSIMRFTSKEGVEIKHVQMFGGMTRPVDIVWLDTTFPGWQGRYKAAVGLGYEGEELLQQVLYNAIPLIEATPSTNDITFD